MRQGQCQATSETPGTGHQEALLWLQLCRVIITRRVCLLVSCPRHHATCGLQTHCRPADLVFVLEENKGKSFSMIYRELHISSSDHFWSREGTCHVSRVS